MKVTETIERECCQRKDLKPVAGTPKFGSDPEFVFCVHCGSHLQVHTFMDAAGSKDWEYRKVKPLWSRDAPPTQGYVRTEPPNQ